MQNSVATTQARAEFSAKALYFLFFAAFAGYVSFLAVFYEDIGLVGWQIGVLTSIPPLATLVVAPLWGAIADATHKRRLIMVVGLIGNLGAVALISVTRSFQWLVIVIIVNVIVSAPVAPFLDGSVVDLLGDHQERYGRIRLWGAVGWGLSAPIVGMLVDAWGLLWIFYIYIALMFVFLLVTYGLPMGGSGERVQVWREVGTLMRNWQWLIFLLAVLISGTAGSIVTNYLFLHMNSLGIKGSVMGWALTIGTISEIPVFFFADTVIRHFGARRVMLFALLAYIVRMLLYAVVISPIGTLSIQLMHGLTYPLMWSAAINYAAKTASPGLRATAQSILSSTMGFGGVFGGLIGGLIYQASGSARLFLYTSLAVFGAFILLVSLWRGNARRPVTVPDQPQA